jgi:hypothetical protein
MGKIEILALAIPFMYHFLQIKGKMGEITGAE